MGGVVDGGVGVGIKTSPRRAAIEKAQAELRQEYDVREERRRELEFLEKGGNPLDFKFGNVTLSLQSTSLNDRHPEQFHSSEAKGSFALAASPHGDSVESSGRPGAPSVSGRNSADNPVQFVGENEMHEGGKATTHAGRKNNITSSEQSSQMDGNRNAKETEDSAIFRPYARRNRSRTNRDGGRLSSADAVHSRGGQGSSLAARTNLRDGKGSSSETNNQKEHTTHTISKPKIVNMNGDVVSRTPTPESRLDGQIDGEQAPVSTTVLKQSGVSGDKFELTTKASKDNRHKQSFLNQKSSIDVACKVPDDVRGGEDIVAGGVDGLPTNNKEREGDATGKLNGSGEFRGDVRSVTNEVQYTSETTDGKVLESTTCPSVGPDVDNNAVCNDAANVNSSGNTVEQTSETEGSQKLVGGKTVEEQTGTEIVDGRSILTNEDLTTDQNQVGDRVIAKVEEEANTLSDLQIKGNSTSCPAEAELTQEKEKNAEATEKNVEMLHDDPDLNKDTPCVARPPVDFSSCEAPTTSLSIMECAAPDHQTSGSHLRVVDKAYEDSILEEARIIEAKRKRIAELSVHSVALESRRRCYWDFVLEEMAWLANDFAQERLWKMTAAAQLCNRIASASRLRFEEQNRQGKLRNVAHSIAKAVMQFWHSAEVLLNGDHSNGCLKVKQIEAVESQRKRDCEITERKTEDPATDSCKTLLLRTDGSTKHPIQGYALRFLRESNSHVYPLQVEAPKTPDTVSHADIMEMSWDDHLTEESLFYTIPSGAMETYRKSIESYLTECERTGSNVQEEVGTSVFGAVADQGYQENAYEEEEAETSTLYLPGAFEGSKSSKFSMKKRKNPTRLYEQGADLSYGHYAIGSQPSNLMEKRPANLNVGAIPTKRMRTASRQRVLSPFGPGPNAGLQAQAKTDASSGDTNSFQDDQNTVHGGSRVQKSMEAESAGDFEKNLPYDFAETSTKPKKKKKPKHLDSSFDQGWQLGSAALNEQREQSKKRLEHFESNGTSGLYAQHNAKKPKMTKQSLDNSYDNVMAMTGSMPGPMASQMSNMSNQNKLMRYIGGRDKSRKVKALKTSSVHSGPGSPWTLFEDQALVVLVHDMGPNWELVSDAINSTLQFKCIFRKPKECKERHKFLMDKTAGDGADSADDSGSSQSYPSTLPGIPKGSARQLFQRLQSPVEEDTLKEHFDRIIQIAQKQHHRRTQLKNESLDPKQIAIHNSHLVALSQVCPNNLNGVFLTPLDLIEATASSPDVLPLSYQGPHAGNLGVSNQSAISSAHPTAGTNSPLPGSVGAVLGTNMLSPSGPFSAPIRDGRYTVPKSSPSPGDDQQRLPYNPVLSNRTIPSSNMSMPGTLSGNDRGVRMLPGGNGLGMASGMNRAMPMPRPGFQGMGSSPMLNSSSMLSSGMVGTTNPVSMHSGSGVNQGSSMLRPREPMHMVRAGHNTEQQRQIAAPEIQMHVTQSNAQGVPPFNGLGSAFPNQTASPVQTYPGHSQQQHQMASQPPHAPNSPHHPQLPGANHPTGSHSQQQMYLRLAKDRNLQQRYLQQQYVASNNMMPHVQSQTQLPISSPLQNNSPIQPQPTSQSLPLPPLTPSSPMTPTPSQHQQKNQLPPHGLARNTTASVGGLNSQMGKQCQRQPQQQQQFQQSGRHHPQQRQPAQPQQQQAKLLKGINRGNMLAHQKLPSDPAHLNGLSVAPGGLGGEKELVQGPRLYPGAGTNPVQPSKGQIPQSSHHSQMQQQLPSGPAPPSSKQHPQPQVPSLTENSSQGQFSPVPPGHAASASHPAVPTTLMASNHQSEQLQQQPQQNQVSQAQPVAQRMLPQNRQMNYDLPIKSASEKAHGEPKLVNSASQAGTGTSTPPVTVDSTNKVPAVTSVIASQRKAPEAVYDAGLPSASSQGGSIGSPTLPSSVRSESLPSVGQGPGQRHLSDTLAHRGHGGGLGSQWQQQQQVKQSPAPPPSSQQLEQQAPQQQLPPLQTQPQTHLQTAQGNAYVGPTNS